MCAVPKLSAIHCIFLHQAKQRCLCLWLLIVGNSNLRLKWSEWLKRGHLIISHPFRCRLGESQGAICIQLEILFKPEPQKALQDCYEMCLINHQISSIGKYIIRDNQDKCVLFSPFWPQPTRDSNKEILTLPLYCSVLQWPFDISIITISKYNFLWMIFRFNKGYIFYLEALLSIHHQQGPRLTRWASCFTNRFRDKGIFSFFFWWNVTNCKLPHFLTYLRQSASCRVCWWIFPPNSSWLRDYEGGPRAGGAIKSHFEDTIPSITLPTHTVNVVWGSG